MLLDEKKVERGPKVSSTGNLIIVEKYLRENYAYWAERLNLPHTRKDKKWVAMRRRVIYLTKEKH